MQSRHSFEVSPLDSHAFCDFTLGLNAMPSAEKSFTIPVFLAFYVRPRSHDDVDRLVGRQVCYCKHCWLNVVADEAADELVSQRL